MSLLPDFSSLQSLLPPSLSFNFGDLQVLLDALYHYRDKCIKDDNDPDLPIFAVDDGRDYSFVCDELIKKIQNYNFK